MLVGLFCVFVGIFCVLVGLFCVFAGILCVFVRLFCVLVGHAWQDDNGGRQESLLIFRNEHSTPHIWVRGWRALLLLLFAEGVWELVFWCVQHQVVHYLYT